MRRWRLSCRDHLQSSVIHITGSVPISGFSNMSFGMWRNHGPHGIVTNALGAAIVHVVYRRRSRGEHRRCSSKHEPRGPGVRRPPARRRLWGSPPAGSPPILGRAATPCDGRRPWNRHRPQDRRSLWDGRPHDRPCPRDGRRSWTCRTPHGIAAAHGISAAHVAGGHGFGRATRSRTPGRPLQKSSRRPRTAIRRPAGQTPHARPTRSARRWNECDGAHSIWAESDSAKFGADFDVDPIPTNFRSLWQHFADVGKICANIASFGPSLAKLGPNFAKSGSKSNFDIPPD